MSYPAPFWVAGAFVAGLILGGSLVWSFAWLVLQDLDIYLHDDLHDDYRDNGGESP